MPSQLFMQLYKHLFVMLVAQPNIHSQSPTPMSAVSRDSLKKEKEKEI
jgi:hypothetical protein